MKYKVAAIWYAYMLFLKLFFQAMFPIWVWFIPFIAYVVGYCLCTALLFVSRLLN